MARFNDTRTRALEAIAGGDEGFIFFKHIHKAGGTSLCQLARTSMITEGELSLLQSPKLFALALLGSRVHNIL